MPLVVDCLLPRSSLLHMPRHWCHRSLYGKSFGYLCSEGRSGVCYWEATGAWQFVPSCEAFSASYCMDGASSVCHLVHQERRLSKYDVGLRS